MPEPRTLEERLQQTVEDLDRRVKHLESLEMVPAAPHVFWQRTAGAPDYLHQAVHGDMVRIYDAADVLMAQFDTATQQMTYPTQAAFSVYMKADMLNLVPDGNQTVQFDAILWERGTNFDVANYRFDAPVTGLYLLTTYLTLAEVDDAATSLRLIINTSNRDYVTLYDPGGYDQDLNRHSLMLTVIADMEAADWARVQVRIRGGAAQMDVRSSATETRFMGWLLG